MPDRAPSAGACDGPESGTTLVELLVVMALMALIAMFIGQGVRAVRGVAPLAARLDASAETAAVRDHLARTIGEAMADLPLAATAPFTGGPDTMRFLAPADPVLEVDGIQRVTLGVAPAAGGGFDLVELRGVARGDLEPDAALPGEARIVLLPAIRALRLAYRGDEPGGTDAVGQPGGPDWRPQWSAAGRLPALVRVEIDLPPGDTRRFSPLLVHPMASPAPADERTDTPPR